MKYCKHCNEETEHTEIKDKTRKVIGYECLTCEGTGHWVSLSVLKQQWLKSYEREAGMCFFKDPAKTYSSDWRLELDSGMEEFQHELLVFRLMYEREFWRRLCVEERQKIDQYENFIKIARRIFANEV